MFTHVYQPTAHCRDILHDPFNYSLYLHEQTCDLMTCVLFLLSQTSEEDYDHFMSIVTTLILVLIVLRELVGSLRSPTKPQKNPLDIAVACEPSNLFWFSNFLQDTNGEAYNFS